MSSHRTLFSREKSIYWPGEFLDVVNRLTGRDQQGAQVTRPLYTYNTGAIVFAASVGVKYQRQRDIGNDRREIPTTTFVGHKLGMYIYLIPLLGSKSPNASMLKPDNEDKIIREFEKYAAGGLEYLKLEFHDSPKQSAEVILERLLGKDSVTGEVLEKIPEF